MTAPLLVTLDDYEAAARERIDPAAWEYIQSGAGDEHTLRWNRESFAGIRLTPRVLAQAPTVDMRVSLLGHELAHPILLAPVASHTLAHPDGEVATARGARAANAGMVLSSYTTIPVEHVAATGVSPLWFQLYLQHRDMTRDLIPRVCEGGCTAICVTVDTPVLGARDRLMRSRFQFPPNLPYRTVDPGDNPCTWADVEWIRSVCRVPLLLKGIMHPDDAEQAVAAGADGIMVSNHGARNLDTTPATIDVLPRIAERVAGQVPVIMDGGIRRGTDVLKALALGADVVMIGRSYVYGLAVAGSDGVAAVVNILRNELAMAMALTGKHTIPGIDRSVIWT